MKNTYVDTFRKLLEDTNKDPVKVCIELKAFLTKHINNDIGVKLNEDLEKMLFAALISANEHGYRRADAVSQEDSFNKGFTRGFYEGYVAHKIGGDDIAYELTCDYFFESKETTAEEKEDE